MQTHVALQGLHMKIPTAGIRKLCTYLFPNLHTNYTHLAPLHPHCILLAPSASPVALISSFLRHMHTSGLHAHIRNSMSFTWAP